MNQSRIYLAFHVPAGTSQTETRTSIMLVPPDDKTWNFELGTFNSQLDHNEPGAIDNGPGLNDNEPSPNDKCDGPHEGYNVQRIQSPFHSESLTSLILLGKTSETCANVGLLLSQIEILEGESNEAWTCSAVMYLVDKGIIKEPQELLRQVSVFADEYANFANAVSSCRSFLPARSP